MRAGEALRWAAGRLRGCVASPGVDAELLSCHVLSVERSGLYAHPDRPLTPAQQAALRGLVARRCGGEPLQYLTGRQVFRRLDLLVGPGVLVPRPETEMVVEHALGRLEGRDGGVGPLVVDVGTGSGAIALSVGYERPDARVWGVEVSPQAAVWARLNLERTGLGNVTVLEGDLFTPLPPGLAGRVDLVVSNPPYLAEAELAEVAPDVRDHEPRRALVSGPTGLEVPLRIAGEAPAWLRPGGWLVMETSPIHAEALQGALGASYGDVAIHPDLTGRPRIATARRL